MAIQKVDAIEAKPVPLSSTKVILERKEYEALKATAKKYIAQEKREGVLQKALDAAKGLMGVPVAKMTPRPPVFSSRY